MEPTACALCARYHERWYELREVQLAVCRDCTIRTIRLIVASSDAELEHIWRFQHPRQPTAKDLAADAPAAVEQWNAATKRFEPISMELSAQDDAAIRNAVRKFFVECFPALALRDVCEAVLKGDDPAQAVAVVFNRRIFLPNAVELLANALFRT
jgi:hypothetical protein